MLPAFRAGTVFIENFIILILQILLVAWYRPLYKTRLPSYLRAGYDNTMLAFAIVHLPYILARYNNTMLGYPYISPTF